VICAYTGYLWARDGWMEHDRPESGLGRDGWIWVPPATVATGTAGEAVFVSISSQRAAAKS